MRERKQSQCRCVWPATLGNNKVVWCFYCGNVIYKVKGKPKLIIDISDRMGSQTLKRFAPDGYQKKIPKENSNNFASPTACRALAPMK